MLDPETDAFEEMLTIPGQPFDEDGGTVADVSNGSGEVPGPFVEADFDGSDEVPAPSVDEPLPLSRSFFLRAWGLRS